MMGTRRKNTNVRELTVVLPALLAGVIEFCLVCLGCALCCCVVLFGPPIFSLSSLMFGSSFSLFPPVHVFGGTRKGPCSFPLLSFVLLCLFCVVVRAPCKILIC